MNNLEKERKVLVTSCGGLTGTYLTKHFCGSGISVVGVDMSGDIPLKTKLDGFYKVPACKDPNYINCIKEIVDKENITHIIPISSYDMVPFSEVAKDSFFEGKMLIVDHEINKLLHNKKNCYSFLSEMGIHTPILYNEENIIFPAICKPCEGSGSKSVTKIEIAQELEFCELKKKQDFIYTEFLEGEEYTVDCLFDAYGNNCGFNIRKRVKTSGGGAVVSENDYTYYDQVKYIIDRLVDYGKVVGPVNFQFKVKNNEVCVFDFNTRLASGGLPLTVSTGLDIPILLLDCIDRKFISKWDCKESGKKLKMIRYYDEVFV